LRVVLAGKVEDLFLGDLTLTACKGAPWLKVFPEQVNFFGLQCISLRKRIMLTNLIGIRHIDTESFNVDLCPASSLPLGAQVCEYMIGTRISALNINLEMAVTRSVHIGMLLV
jgi:hypothetical protein